MKKKIEYVVFIGVLAMLVGCATSIEKVLAPEQEAKQFYDRGDYANAVLKYSIAIAGGDSSYESFFYRGMSNKKLGKFLLAISDFTQAISSHPDNDGQARLQRCRLNYLLKNYVEAEKDASSLLVSAPMDQELVAVKVFSLFESGNKKGLDAFVERARRIIDENSADGLKVTKCHAVVLFYRNDAKAAYRVFFQEYVQILKTKGEMLSRDDRAWAARICDMNLKNKERDFYLGR